MIYHEFSLQPEYRTGVMVPRSSLPDFYARPDAGYCSVFGFSAEAAFAIRAQGNSQGLGRFPVYSDRLWIDLDAANSDPEEVERVKNYARELTKKFQAMDYNFTVWDSGSKGFHICVKIEPMQGLSVPDSQLAFVRDTLQVRCDESLYQASRLLSNPGRVHPKTGRKKSKIYEYKGQVICVIPTLPHTPRKVIDSDSLTSGDLARIGYSRLTSMIQDAPLAGNRHQRFWSIASHLLEAGMPESTVFGNLVYLNKFLPQPKSEDEILRAVKQAAHQLGIS